MTMFESFAANMITNNIDMMQEQFKKVDDLESQLVVANNHIRDLENKNKLLVDKLAQQQAVFTPPPDNSPEVAILKAKVNDLERDIEELEGNLLTLREDRDGWADKYQDANRRYIDWVGTHGNRIEELEKQLLLEQQERKKLLESAAKQRNDSDLEAAHWRKQYKALLDDYNALKQNHQTTVEELEELQSESDFYGIANGSMDKQLATLKIKLGLAYNQSVDLLVSCNLVVANLLSDADIDLSVVAALMQQVGSLNHTLEELSHV